MSAGYDNPDCHYGDHSWMGGGICVRCYERLRCYCGMFIREDGIREHLQTTCPLAFDQREQEREKIGDLYVQKRTLTKDVYPGYYDVATGGVLQAGETYEQSAERELAEELGIRNIPQVPLFDF